ncbi:MAG: PepSY-associated TM helix domain-containing protein [Planctomycetota bacterium]
MRLYKLLWDTHRWVGVGASLLVVLAASTGLLLLLKKDVAWIQPPTQRDRAEGPYLSIEALYERLFALGRPDLRSEADIERVDFRPGKKVYKVHLVRDHQEVQVGAVSGAILSQEKRWSDFLEDLHDGSFAGGLAHGWLWPLFAACLAFLALSGLWLWLEPLLRRARRRRAHAKAEPPP